MFVMTNLVFALFLVVVPITAQETGTAVRKDHVDVYHGIRVADPYRWMEQMDGPETVEWVAFQDSIAREFAASNPARKSIHDRLTSLMRGVRFTAPTVRGGIQFFMKSGGDLPAPTVWMSSDGESEQLIDPMAVDPSGSSRVSRIAPSDDGRYLAYGLTAPGSRWETWRVRDLRAGEDLPDRLVGLNRNRSGLPEWNADGSGFYYERFSPPLAGAELNHRVEDEALAFHRLGSAQHEDVVILDPEDPDVGLVSSITADRRHLVLQVGIDGEPNNSVTLVHVGDHSIVELIEKPEAPYWFVGSQDGEYWFMTNRDAPNWKVIAVSVNDAAAGRMRDLIPERNHAIDPTIGALALSDKIVVGYRRDARLLVDAFNTDGTHAYQVELHDGGETWTFRGSQRERYAFYRLHSVVDPGTTYRLDLQTGQSTIHQQPALPYDPREFITRQVFYHSRDGTRIPMFLVHRRDIELDGTNPVFLYGYGAFSWAAAPWFQPKVAVWLQMGGVYALPNIRGGGEYGESWHLAGIGRNKQNSIDDFLAAAEWLVDEGYTSTELLVGNGGSASGPLIGAAIVQRPDLFGASIIDSPALDMLRLEAFTGGRGWRSDFGTVANPDDFDALLAYSPYHNVEPGTCYPATLVVPGERDEATVPMHAYKFTAALQHAQSCDNPIQLRVFWGAGHLGNGATPGARIDNWADQLSFLSRVLKIEPSTNGERTGY